MPTKKTDASEAVAPSAPEPPRAKIKHQADHGQTPWKPGEIPSMRNGTMRSILKPSDDIAQPYGETLGIQPPANRGDGYSPIRIVDLEGHETNVKQTGRGK